MPQTPPVPARTVDATDLQAFGPALDHARRVLRDEATRLEGRMEPTTAQVLRGTAADLEDLRELVRATME